MNKLTLAPTSKMNSPDFIFGVATAAFQIEGAANTRLPNIWDTFCSIKGNISDGSNGDIACDHVNLWQQDLALIASLGVDAYRLSIAWPRVMTKEGTLNQAGVDFYIRLLDQLKTYNIKAFVTLYHWDLPQYLEDQGGWLNRNTAYEFAHYADLISQAFGERVYAYATLNEPFCSAYLGYEAGIHAPGLKGKQYGKKAAHHLLLGHGLAMLALQKNSPKSQNGIVLNFTPAYPASDSKADINAARYADDYFNQWYIKPIFNGCYPDLINTLPKEQQPDILPGDMTIISQKLDYIGVNYYTRAVYQADATHIFKELPPQAPKTDIGWQIYPQAFSQLLTHLHQTYPLPPMYITENGAAMADKLEHGHVHDQNRIDYYQSHLDAVNDAIDIGVDIRGYFAWSLMDNFEWAEGYSKRFGIVYVDYQTQQRTIKASGLAYRNLILQRNQDKK
ncbi:GH1 family beta-glucosidase [Pseudoalteromonas tunicata]|uniref:Beta-glucosidase n=1 Tax=Pseudoalteromonas tunicata D2 TaxID=87626 RepID=A4C562_9GAMM|nr:GH1 family beta-glucosidase [Pseudoalteromonas tunicata]ATC96832.1 beta-glucosidase [Pseudoalteromonas tunicata]AXT32973.1 beta-glucosidase [Pseudoalteromonas tunicata]EAR30694.1 beta-glucosidase [Pseudoalteromonas tunicata D2]